MSDHDASESVITMLRNAHAWLAGGLSTACFAVGLGFGQAASAIDHSAGAHLGTSGVDLGLTRATALSGQRDALTANGLFISAGVAAIVGLVFVALSPAGPEIDQ